MKTSKHLILFITILLVTVGQLACAVYLPSLPAIQQVFQATPSGAQLTYNLILLGYGVSMCFYGGLSDYFGRKKLIIMSLIIFLVGSVITCIASNIETLLIARLIQGLGLGGVGIGRAILRDIFSEKEFVKATSYITMSVTITPLLAPVIGGHIQHWFNWRGNFILILIYGLLVGALAWRFLPETHCPKSGQFSAKHMLSTYANVLKNRQWFSLLLIALMAFSGEMAYNISAPFLLQDQLHWTPLQYGYLILVTLGGFFVGAFLNSTLINYVDRRKLLTLGTWLLLLGSIVLVLFSSHLTTLRILLPTAIFMAGVAITTTNAGASANLLFRENIGAAASLYMGLMLLVSGALSALVVGMRIQDQQPLAYTLLGFSIAAVVIRLFTKE